MIPGTHIETLLELDLNKDPELMDLLEQEVKEVIHIINEVLKIAFPEMKDIDKYIKKQIRKSKYVNYAITNPKKALIN